jgi:hypothetical protein
MGIKIQVDIIYGLIDQLEKKYGVDSDEVAEACCDMSQIQSDTQNLKVRLRLLLSQEE